MNPSRAAGNQNKSFSTRLYRLTQQHKHWFFIVPGADSPADSGDLPYHIRDRRFPVSRHFCLAVAALCRFTKLRAHAQQR